MMNGRPQTVPERASHIYAAGLSQSTGSAAFAIGPSRLHECGRWFRR